MRKDIQALNEAYMQATTPKKEPKFEYDIQEGRLGGGIITIYDVPTVNKATDEDEPITYAYEYAKDNIADDLKLRRMVDANDQEVEYNDYYVDESDAVRHAYIILLRAGEVEFQHHG